MGLRILLLILLFLVSGCPASTGVYHTVDKGQTLYRISKAYGVNELYLARINGVDDPTALPVGKRLFIPGARKLISVSPTVTDRPKVPKRQPRSQISTAPSQKSAADKKTSFPPTQSPKNSASKPTRMDSSKAEKRVSVSAAPAKGQFIWPLRGKIIRNFCLTGKNPCKGLEIAVKVGTPILAASAGKVIYSGDGIRGYGNLIIIRHDDEFFSVYGFNKQNLVPSGTFVSKGQKIALSGRPPSGGESRLHFEIRYGKDSVNPSLYLP